MHKDIEENIVRLNEREKLFENILVSVCDINSKYRTEANAGDRIEAQHITDRLLSIYDITEKELSLNEERD